ncbi:hypothetical protein [Sodalis sp. RH18]|uniref:hypothetical protein n=1 Tax=Sodalis sp. RH18 TaxID=3394333 RepID=UPI0039B66038
MMDQQKLIEYVRYSVKYLETRRDEIPFGLGEFSSMDLEIYRRALASLTGAPQPVSAVMDILSPILAEIERAMRKFPMWPTDTIHASKIIDEEIGEVSKAVLQAIYEPHKSGPEQVREEAIQATAMCIRFIASLDKYQYVPSAQHEQPGLFIDTPSPVGTEGGAA